MSFNFGSLQQKADQVIHNADEAIRKWQEFVSAPAGDVSFQYYDKNGNLQTATFPNRNKVVNDFIANVNNAMEKTFYVDMSGDDNNDGSSTSPFRTLQKAIDSIPPGGVGSIYLLSDYTLEGTVKIYYGKNISIVGANTNSDGSPVITLRNEPNNPNSLILVHDSFLHLNHIKLECNNNGGAQHWSTLLKVDRNRNSTISMGYWTDLSKNAHPVEIILNHPMINIESSIVNLIINFAKVTASSAESLVAYSANGKCMYIANGVYDVNSNVTFPTIGIN